MSDPPVDLLVLFPEPAFELQAYLTRVHVGNGIDSPAGIGGKIVIDIAEDWQRDGAYTKVGRQTSLGALFIICHCYPLLCIMDSAYFRIEMYDPRQPFLKGSRDPVHATHSLEKGHLQLIGILGDIVKVRVHKS